MKELVHTYYDIDLGVAGAIPSTLGVDGMDDATFMFEKTAGASTVTAVIQCKVQITGADPASGTTALSMDGTHTTVDVEHARFIVPTVTTTQSGYMGNLHVYARPRAPRAFA